MCILRCARYKIAGPPEGFRLKLRTLLFVLVTFTLFWNPVRADDGDSAQNRFFASENWKYRLGLTAFEVDDSVTFGIGFGVKGEYTTAGGIRLELRAAVIAEDDRDELDSDHIPIWFKNKFKADKQLLAFSPSLRLDATLDFDHKMNTVSSIEQSATLIPGIKAAFNTERMELYAKFGAGGYYLEIDDDLPEEYSDYRREDLSSSEFALLQEYRAWFALTDVLSLSCRYKDYRDTDWHKLESSKKIEFAYTANPRRRFVLEAEKTWYDLDQFSRSAGDNGLAILPFDDDVFYQAYLEFNF